VDKNENGDEKMSGVRNLQAIKLKKANDKLPRYTVQI